MRTPFRIAVLTALLLAAIATGIRWVVAQDSTITYHACVNNSSGTIFMVAPDKACKLNETRVTWNNVGPAGPPGPPGPSASQQFKVFTYSIPSWTISCLPGQSCDTDRFFEVTPDSNDSALVGASIKADVLGADTVSLLYFEGQTGLEPVQVFFQWWNGWGSTEWLHLERHSIGSGPDNPDGTTWGCGSPIPSMPAGLPSYPFRLRISPVFGGTSEVRNLEVKVYYLDNALAE